MRRLLTLVLFVLAACGGGGGSASATLPPSSAPAPTSSPAMWAPSTTDSFQWILSAPLDTTAPATVYDIDAFDATSSDVAALHALGRHAVCYINVGAFENWRPDASSFPPAVIGSAYAGWPGENWLDIRRMDLLGPIMNARFDTCASKGFDAVEPDNIDGYQNATGFALTASDQIAYNTWIASLAHARHLSIALKNDADQLQALLPSFDFAIDEDCWQQGWCAQLAPMRAAAKAVITVEYTDLTTAATFTGTDCPQAKSAGYYALLKHRNLDAWYTVCP
ncbi:MAG TPA: endo alpha-1,4 polygalactosaminidase [Candidatus Aquilonibacter sp.]|nr:endo alpha-1,4 polygalactosaminidase [Candidatus Aquilonibacter sp.]